MSRTCSCLAMGMVLEMIGTTLVPIVILSARQGYPTYAMTSGIVMSFCFVMGSALLVLTCDSLCKKNLNIISLLLLVLAGVSFSVAVVPLNLNGFRTQSILCGTAGSICMLAALALFLFDFWCCTSCHGCRSSCNPSLFLVGLLIIAAVISAITIVPLLIYGFRIPSIVVGTVSVICAFVILNLLIHHGGGFSSDDACCSSNNCCCSSNNGCCSSCKNPCSSCQHFCSSCQCYHRGRGAPEPVVINLQSASGFSVPNNELTLDVTRVNSSPPSTTVVHIHGDFHVHNPQITLNTHKKRIWHT